jgi:SHS2 domain-containing protein
LLGPSAIFEPLPAASPPFEILEHPADIGFRAFGATLEELFENAALALVSIASEVADIEPRQEYSLETSASDTESLLVAWLSEVLYWFDGRRINFRHFRVTEIHSRRVAGMGLGEPRDPARHGAKLIVKAVTWHQLKVWQERGRWIAEVYLDV